MPTRPYYLGNFWYAHRRYREAIACWERAARARPALPHCLAQPGPGLLQQAGRPAGALACFETAFELNPADARVLFELDQLYKKLNPDRLPSGWQTCSRHLDLVDQRDDLTIELVSLLNLLGRPEEAFQRLMRRTFHPWEGGEGKVTGQYVTSLVELAKAALASGKPAAAVDLLEQAQVYPPNLGEGKLYGAQENHIFYYLGCAYVQLGEPDRAGNGSSAPRPG